METTLKILFLNLCAGREHKALLQHLGSLQTPYDIMLFTEVSHTTPQATVRLDLKSKPALLDAHSFLTNHLNGQYEHRFDAGGTENWTCLDSGDICHNVAFGSSLFQWRTGKFVRFAWGAELIDTGYTEGKPRVLQWVCVLFRKKRYLIAHLHGVWIRGNTKGDSPERDRQSNLVRIHLKALMTRNKAHYLIFGGDLNLGLETRALSRLEGGGDGPRLKNLIREYDISSTRTPLYRDYATGTLHADYVMVSPETPVVDFTVDTNVLASDHAPLVLTVS